MFWFINCIVLAISYTAYQIFSNDLDYLARASLFCTYSEWPWLEVNESIFLHLVYLVLVNQLFNSLFLQIHAPIMFFFS